ncbi:MAG: alpha-L-fucosidase, partial [Candidatus Amulumruptor sp.]|nr:alpha-L-fucosidase [Candidatus Amulumruptor sp.]
MIRHFLTIAIAAAAALGATAQDANSFVHQQSDASGYEWPTDTAVLKKLDHWQDQKFGVLFHMGIYSVPGICESWTICSEDWIVREGNPPYDEYKRWYFAQADSLNPTDFNPDEWARIMKDAGMRY